MHRRQRRLGGHARAARHARPWRGRATHRTSAATVAAACRHAAPDSARLLRQSDLLGVERPRTTIPSGLSRPGIRGISLGQVASSCRLERRAAVAGIPRSADTPRSRFERPRQSPARQGKPHGRFEPLDSLRRGRASAQRQRPVSGVFPATCPVCGLTEHVTHGSSPVNAPSASMSARSTGLPAMRFILTRSDSDGMRVSVAPTRTRREFA